MTFEALTWMMNQLVNVEPVVGCYYSSSISE
jgi:hypothetical protein